MIENKGWKGLSVWGRRYGDVWVEMSSGELSAVLLTVVDGVVPYVPFF